ncbi:transposase [Effusibacillus dendaii]|uniref:transposase n=1 Tax=Effusibacillus dendaii TaxID=2743772 RepID=UPI00190CEA98|nr:transposase [Effusibacillus dendaii]
METDIHYPTDASLLQDGVRVITRIAKAMKESSTELTSQIKDRSRTIRNKVFSISKVLKRRTQEAISEVRQITGEILDVTQDVVRSGWTLLQETTEKAKSLPSKVINRLLPRTEFGYKVLLEETEDQIIVGYDVFEGNPGDDTLLNDSLDRFEETFQRVPTAVATDRGFSSKSNEESLRQRGVKKIRLPRKGKTSRERREFEKTSGFKRLQRFRAAGEATISVLKRCYGLRRSLFHGKQGTGAWTGYAIFARNLNRLSRTMKQKSSKIVLQ